MKILKQEKLTGSQIKLEIEVSREELDEYQDTAYKKLASDLKIPGFRPGKVPKALATAEIGKEKILSQALELAIQQTYYEALKSKEILAISNPEINIKTKNYEDKLIYEAKVPVMPTIKLPDYINLLKNSNLKISEIKVESSEIETVLKQIQRGAATFKPIKKAASKGDWVIIDFDGGFEKGKIEPSLSSKNHPLIIGEKQFIPGFEEKILGMNIGETKEFDLNFPPDYYKKELKDKKVYFEVHLVDLKEVILPQIDDEFAKNITGVESLAKLKENIKNQIKQQKESEEKKILETKILDLIISKSEIDLPEILIKEELDFMISQLSYQLTHKGLSLEQYLSQLEKSQEELRASWRDEACKRVKIALVLSRISKTEKIEIKDEEIDKEIKNLGKSLEIKEEKVNLTKNRDYIKNILKNRKTIERLMQITADK